MGRRIERKRKREKQLILVITKYIKYIYKYFRYKIDHITAENKYRFNLQTSVCLESVGACDLDFSVMTDVDIPILDCDFGNVPYAVKGLEKINNHLKNFAEVYFYFKV